MAQATELWAFQRKEDKTFLYAPSPNVPLLFSSVNKATTWVNNMSGDKVKRYFADTFDLVEVIIQQRMP